MKIHRYIIIFLYTGIHLFGCQYSGLSEVYEESNRKIKLAAVSQLGPTTATISWECSSDSEGSILYGKIGIEHSLTSLTKAKFHSMTLSNLESFTSYIAIVSCGKVDVARSVPIFFKTLISDFPNRTRGIWIIGGIGSDARPIAEVDLFDPVEQKWYPSITNLPTARAYASVISHKGKIYVIGGLEKRGASFVVSKKVDVFDPYTDNWTQKSDLPTGSQGAIVASIGDDIYIIGGTTTTDMTTGTILNTVLKLSPSLGANGTWFSLVSSSAIFQRIDMAGCSFEGSILYTGGRLFSSGVSFANSDGFTPALNSTTQFSEPSINLARHGAAAACVKPEPTDTYPTDSQWFAVIGGSTGVTTEQPVGAITPSNRTDFYQLGSGVFSPGPILPASIYYPASEASYETRKLYVFGGAISINIPTNDVYVIDLQNPINGTWSSSLSMPRLRYAHKAIRIDR